MKRESARAVATRIFRRHGPVGWFDGDLRTVRLIDAIARALKKAERPYFSVHVIRCPECRSERGPKRGAWKRKARDDGRGGRR